MVLPASVGLRASERPSPTLMKLLTMCPLTRTSGDSVYYTNGHGDVIRYTFISADVVERVDESDRRLCRSAVLELGVGALGHVAGGADDDGHQSDLRSCRAVATGRAFAR